MTCRSRRRGIRSAKLDLQPAFRVSPVVIGGCDGDSNRIRGLLPRQPGEVAELHELCRARIVRFESIEGLIEREEVELRAANVRVDIRDFDALMPTRCRSPMTVQLPNAVTPN